MNEQRLRQMVKEEIKKQFLNESTPEELVTKTLNVLGELKALRGETKSFYNKTLDSGGEGDIEFGLYYSISEAIKEISKALTQFKRIKR